MGIQPDSTKLENSHHLAESTVGVPMLNSGNFCPDVCCRPLLYFEHEAALVIHDGGRTREFSNSFQKKIRDVLDCATRTFFDQSCKTFESEFLALLVKCLLEAVREKYEPIPFLKIFFGKRKRCVLEKAEAGGRREPDGFQRFFFP